MKGCSDGRFAPDDSISRAQLSEILYRVWGCKPNSARTFADVPAGAWYYDVLTTMATYDVTFTHGVCDSKPQWINAGERAPWPTPITFPQGSNSARP